MGFDEEAVDDAGTCPFFLRSSTENEVSETSMTGDEESEDRKSLTMHILVDILLHLLSFLVRYRGQLTTLLVS